MLVSWPVNEPSTVIPDYKSALIDYLRRSATMTAVVAPEHIVEQVFDVQGENPSNWLAIVSSGGWGRRNTAPLFHVFVRFHCYGANGYEAQRIWRTVKSILDPIGIAKTSFVSRNVVFYNVKVGAPDDMMDPGKIPWPKRVAVGEVVFNEVPLL